MIFLYFSKLITVSSLNVKFIYIFLKIKIKRKNRVALIYVLYVKVKK